MQLYIQHKLASELDLPINYNHILQSIIFDALRVDEEYARQMHDQGYENRKRSYKMFQFSQLKGPYRIQQKRIIFRDTVSFEIRSPDQRLLTILKDQFTKNGIYFGGQHMEEIEAWLEDKTVEQTELVAKMLTPVTVHTTDMLTKKTTYYAPDSQRFGELINENFLRKYKAYFGVEPESNIEVEPIAFSEKDRFVTKYKGFYISGWFGLYRVRGDRKYLDFLYQTGLGDRNSQGFGMFETKESGV